VFAAWGGAPWNPPQRADDSEGVTPTPLSVLVRGTNFQVRVWEALLRIPPGAVATYEDIASAIGSSGATRAVASAIARNPVAYLIPCHRVIRKTGAFGGYHWGTARKVAMLLRETSPAAVGDASTARGGGDDTAEPSRVAASRGPLRDYALAVG
jgi:AraC family transcriptional regulator of adaptative response/methylated-DNA-[protein]-cysteine methyltransferase